MNSCDGSEFQIDNTVGKSLNCIPDTAVRDFLSLAPLLLTRIKYRFVKIQDMDEVLCRTVFLRSFNVLVCVDSINFFIV